MGGVCHVRCNISLPVLNLSPEPKLNAAAAVCHWRLGVAGEAEVRLTPVHICGPSKGYNVLSKGVTRFPASLDLHLARDRQHFFLHVVNLFACRSVFNGYFEPNAEPLALCVDHSSSRLDRDCLKMGKNLSPKISSDKKELILDSFSIGTRTKYYGNTG